MVQSLCEFFLSDFLGPKYFSILCVFTPEAKCFNTPLENMFQYPYIVYYCCLTIKALSSGLI